MLPEPVEKKLRVLMVEDSQDDADLVLAELRRGGFDIAARRVQSASGVMDALAQQQWDIVISDYSLPGFTGPEALQLAQGSAPDIPFIVISGCIGEEAAVALMKAGAEDYVFKGDLARLVPAVERSLKEARNRLQRRIAQEALRESEARFKAIASNIPGMVFQMLLRGDGTQLFTYVSEGCEALFGVKPQILLRHPEFLFDLVAPEHLPSFRHTMRASAETLAAWNWEGRVRVSGTSEIKWVNLRSSSRRLDDGAIRWDGIMSNTTQSKEAEMELRRSREQLSELSAHIQVVKERERTSIAREIHDDLGGTLTAVKIELLRLTNLLLPDQDALLNQSKLIESMVDGAIGTTRRISTDLRPAILDLGITAAVEWQAREFGKRMGIECSLNCPHEEIDLEPDVSFAVFRIFQETLTNIAKHAHASRVAVNLEAADSSVRLSVTDNGRGVAEGDSAKPGSFGIRGMVERARNLGGQASVSSAAGGGTTVTVCIPSSARPCVRDPGGAGDPQLTLFSTEIPLWAGLAARAPAQGNPMVGRARIQGESA